MKNLDELNPTLARPQNMVPIGSTLTFLMGGMGAILASDATPNIAFFDNILALICVALCPAAIFTAVIPRIQNWDWKTKYFGFTTISLASGCIMGIVPWLCIVLHSELALSLRLTLFIVYAATVTWWCGRYATYYRKIYADSSLRTFIYATDYNEIYYLQKNDTWLLEKKFKFKNFPSSAMTITSVGLAFAMFPFIDTINELVGLPFAYSFLTIASLTTTMMLLGLSTKCFLVFYYYPIKLKKESGKEVYVDMATKSVFAASP